MIKMKVTNLTIEKENFNKIKFELLTRYPYILQVNSNFQIIINDCLFFDEPDFPILEFLKCSMEWINSDSENSLVYESIETNDNPLITVKKDKGKYFIYSPWAKCSTCLEVNEEELRVSIVDLYNEVCEKIYNLLNA